MLLYHKDVFSKVNFVTVLMLLYHKDVFSKVNFVSIIIHIVYSYFIETWV